MPFIEPTPPVQAYAVADNDDVTLKITIGERQFGRSRVALDGAAPRTGGFKELALGKGRDLAGKTLTVETTVSDLNAETNAMTVEYRLEGGASTLTTPLAGTAAQEGDLLDFRATFRFVA